MLRFALILVLCVVTPAYAAAVTAYAVADDNFDYPDHIVEIDLLTGDFKSFGQIPDPYIGIEGMAISANDIIYGADDNTKTLVQIDLTDGRAMPVANVNQNFGFPRSAENHDYGMSFACNGTLYMVNKHSQSLYEVNTDTGRATLIGKTGHNFTSLASWDNRLYAVASGDFTLYEVNPETAEASVVGSLGDLGGGIHLYGSGMSFDGDGQLWMILNLRLSDPLNPLPSRIFKVNHKTGEAEFVSETLVGVESLAISNGSGCARGIPIVEQVPVNNQWFLLLLMSSVLLIGTAVVSSFAVIISL